MMKKSAADFLSAAKTTLQMFSRLIKTMYLKAVGFFFFDYKIKNITSMKAQFYVQIKRKVQWHHG